MQQNWQQAVEFLLFLVYKAAALASRCRQQGVTSTACNYISFYFYFPLITYFLLMHSSINAINDRDAAEEKREKMLNN